jgi:glycosyltransferase involved in cell wall biosynthesis
MSEQPSHAERRALIAEVALQKREVELRLAELEDARAEIARFHDSATWRLFERARRKLYALLGGRGSRAGRLLAATGRRVGALDERAESQRRWRALRMPAFPSAEITIVAATRSDARALERRLRAIAMAGDAVAFEAIVVDLGRDAETRRLLGAVEGVRVVARAPGEADACAIGRAVAAAGGSYVVLLDDGFEPQPGWLDALIGRARSGPGVGAVVAKLLRVDGDLLEAGGIVWRDGRATPFGEGERRDAPEYDYVREVDYGSAALLVSRELWQAIGGLDERFGPGPYRAADLCLAVRAAGRTVLYEPRAVVCGIADRAPATVTGADGLRERDRATLVGKWARALDAQPQRGEHSAYLAADRNRGPHVLVVDHRVPMPDRDAGSLRMLHVVRQLVDIGCRVTFMPDAPVADGRYRRALQALGVVVLDPDSDVAAYLAAAGDRTRLAILSRPHVASRYVHVVREHAPAARIAYDTVDLHYVRERRRADLEGDAVGSTSAALRELELALARACDVTLVVSDDERRQLLAEQPDLELEILPLANEPWSQTPPRAGRSGVLFVGGFAHHPNVGAALELAGQVMPLVWAEIGEVALTIVGSGPPSDLRALASDRVEVRGWVEDLAPLLAGSVAMAVPLRYGAGVKGKITESMAAGLPVVTTAVGAEGLDAEHGDDILIGAEPDELARQIVELHGDAELWARLSENGRDLVARTCSPAAQRPVLERLLAP